MRLTSLKNFNLPKALFFLAVLSFPYNFFQPLDVNFTISDVFLFLCLFSILPHIKIPNQLLIAPFLLLFGYCMSAFNVIDAPQCFLGMLQYFTVFLVLPLLAYNVIKTEIDLQQIIFVYFAALFISFFYDIGILAEIFPKTYPTYRLGGTFANPNDLAKIAGVSTIGAFVLLTCLQNNMYKKIFLFVYFCVAISLIAASGSFGGFIFMSITLITYIVFFIFYLSRKLRTTMMIKFVLSLIILSIVLPVSLKHYESKAYKKRFLKADSFETMGTAESKLDQISYGIEFLLDSPLVGVGCEQIRHYYGYEKISIHNFYLIVANEGGIIALSGLLILLGLMFRGASRLTNTALKVFFYFTILSFLLNAISSPNLYSRYHWFPIFFAFADIKNHLKSLSPSNYLRELPFKK